MLAKDTQVESMRNELKNVGFQITDLKRQKSLSQKETFVYRTDTIYVKQIEYINTVSDPAELKVVRSGAVQEQPELMELAKAQEDETDDMIFPSYSNTNIKQASETIKLKFGTFTAKN